MTSPSSANISVPGGHVGLVLLEDNDDSSKFYLQIPLDSIASLCLNPVSYLLFLGWCILGVEGGLTLGSNGGVLDPDGGLELEDEGIYYYVKDEGDLQAVDLEVIKMRTNVPSETTSTRDDFRTSLLARDFCCVWTGAGEDYGNGLHIIPYKRGFDWLKLIVENRPHYEEDVDDLHEINDIRNGVFANSLIHAGYDSRKIVVLKTPNRYLQPGDIPRHDRNPSSGVVVPSDGRFTLQYLITDASVSQMIPNNLDAAFKRYTRKPKPSDLLLHYNYGAAAVKCWGHGTDVLRNRLRPPRPVAPVPAEAGPSRTVNTRTTAIRKREEAQERGMTGKRGSTRKPVAAPVEAGSGEEEREQATWDEDDVILFFWGNTRAAKERHGKNVHESAQRMDLWRKGLSSV